MTEQLMDDLTNEEHEALLLISEHAIAAPLLPAAQAVLERAMEFSGPAFERLVRQMLGEAIRSVVAHTQQHRGNDVWTCDADEILAIVAKLEALPND